ncbi:MAG TPA: tetratricopeptide repeat protein [Candidatus Binatia bacterium]|nr:tetratricopeptide repeat protein [Candidatus Binatia bacterium]
MTCDKIIAVERKEYVEEILALFDLTKGAAAPEILEKYLEKTLQLKFQRILIPHEELKKEFVRYHEAFVNLLKFLQSKDNTLKMSLFSSDQLAKFFFNQGIYALCKDNYLQAGEKFQEAYKINRHNVFLLTYLGIILTVRKNYYAAEKYFADAIHRDPNNDDARFYAAQNFFKAGLYPKASEYFEKAKQLNPTNNEIAFWLKDCREAMQKKTKRSEKDTLLRKIVTYFRNAFRE